MQLGNALMEEDHNEDENEEEEEEEEEEDSEKDPNWVDGEENRTPKPIRIEEDPNNDPNLPNLDFDQDLQIPNRHRAVPEFDPSLWRDIYEYGKSMRVVSETPINPLENEASEDVMLREARENVRRIWEEAGEEVMKEENREIEDKAEKEEEEESEQEEQTWPPRRRRMTIRDYLSQFVRRNNGSSSSGDCPPTPTLGDS